MDTLRLHSYRPISFLYPIATETGAYRTYQNLSSLPNYSRGTENFYTQFDIPTKVYTCTNTSLKEETFIGPHLHTCSYSEKHLLVLPHYQCILPTILLWYKLLLILLYLDKL